MNVAVQPIPVQFSPSPAQLAVAYSVCRSITRASAKNFYYAFLVLPRHKRAALCAIYAYMRRCDDIADDMKVHRDQRRLQLAQWLDAVHRAQAGEPTDDPVLLALTDVQRRYDIPVVLLDQLAHGTAMDIEDEADAITIEAGKPAPHELALRYRTFEDLYLYCYKVASVVGLVCIRIFGYKDEAAELLAERCGLAFQLTNIIRDVKEDVTMRRIYLPEEDFARFGVSPYELFAVTDPARFRPLLAMEADRAREYYRAAEELIPLISEDSQPALWVLVTIYRRLLEKIAKKNYNVFYGKIRLTTREKLAILGKGLVQRLT